MSSYEADFKDRYLFFGDNNGLVRALSLINDKFQNDLLDKHTHESVLIKIDYLHDLIVNLYDDWSLYIQKKDFFQR